MFGPKTKPEEADDLDDVEVIDDPDDDPDYDGPDPDDDFGEDYD